MYTIEALKPSSSDMPGIWKAACIFNQVP